MAKFCFRSNEINSFFFHFYQFRKIRQQTRSIDQCRLWIVQGRIQPVFGVWKLHQCALIGFEIHAGNEPKLLARIWNVQSHDRQLQSLIHWSKGRYSTDQSNFECYPFHIQHSTNKQSRAADWFCAIQGAHWGKTVAWSRSGFFICGIHASRRGWCFIDMQFFGKRSQHCVLGWGFFGRKMDTCWTIVTSNRIYGNFAWKFTYSKIFNTTTMLFTTQ